MMFGSRKEALPRVFTASPCKQIPTLVTHDGFSNQLMSSHERRKIPEGSSRNQSTKKHKLKTVKKYKISFSYVCTSGHNSSDINTKILNLQSLDQVATSSDHRFVSHKLKPVMTCVVQRLIQEYKRSKESSKLQKYRSKPSTNDTYSLSSSSCENLAKIKMVKALEKGRKEDIITTTNLMKEKHYYNNSDERSEENIKTLKSYSTSRLKKNLKMKQNSSTISKPLMTCNSSSPSASPGYTRRSISINRNSNTGHRLVLCFAKDTFLFKRTKISNYINSDILTLITQGNLLNSDEEKYDNTYTKTNVEEFSPLNIYLCENPLDDLFVSQLLPYCGNIYLSEYSITAKYSFNTITDNICRNYVCLSANIENYESFCQPSIQDSNYSNENEMKEDKNEISNHSKKDIISNKNESPQEFNLNKLDPNVTSCLLLKNIARKNSRFKMSKSFSHISDDETSSSSKYSVMADCEICHGDPVICFEAECRKSVMEQYVDLLEEAQGIIINRKSDNAIDMEHLKKMMYNFMEENNLYPSEQVKTDILRRKSIDEIIENINSDKTSNLKKENFNEILQEETIIVKDDIKEKNESINKEETNEFDEKDQKKDDNVNLKIEDDPKTLIKKETISNLNEELEQIESFPILSIINAIGKSMSSVRKETDSLQSAILLEISDPKVRNSFEMNEIGTPINLVKDKKDSFPTTFYLPEIIVQDTSSKHENSLIPNVTDVDQLKVSIQSLTNEENKEIISDNKAVTSDIMSKRSNSLKVVLSDIPILNEKDLFPSIEEIEAVIEREGLVDHLDRKSDEEEFTDSNKVLVRPLGRRTTIFKNSVFQTPEPINNLKFEEYEKSNPSVEIEQFPSNDFFVEIEDHIDKSQRKLSVIGDKLKVNLLNDKFKDVQDEKITKSSSVYDSNDSPPTVSSSSSIVQISTYSDLRKVEPITSETSSESTTSQDTFEDVAGKYPNETTNFIDMSNDISLENEEKVINSLRRSLKKDISVQKEPYLDGNYKKDKKEKVISVDERKISNSKNVAKKDITSNDNMIREKEISKSQIVTVEKYTQVNSDTFNKIKSKSPTVFHEMETQTDFENKILRSNESIKENVKTVDETPYDKYTDIKNIRQIPQDQVTEPTDHYGKEIDKNLEIDNLLNKLRRILSKSEEYLQTLSEISKKSQNYDPANISQEILNLLKNICKNDDSIHLSDEERYTLLNQNLEKLCKALNSTENKLNKDVKIDEIPSKEIHQSKFDVKDNIFENLSDRMVKDKQDDRNHVEFLESDSTGYESLLDQVVRCVMSKLIESQSRSCVSQGTSTNIRNQDFQRIQKIPQTKKYEGDPTLSRSLENMNFMKNQIPRTRFHNKSDDIDDINYIEEFKNNVKNNYPFRLDSFIGECLPKESTDMINLVRSNQKKLDRINIYDEIACRMKDLLQQVKKSQKEVASRHSVHSSNNKIPFSNIGFSDRNNDRKWPRSYSVSDLEGSRKSPKRDVTRHTVASIQNISSTLNQSRKMKSGFRNLRKELKDKGNRLMINLKTRQKMLCSSVEEDNISNSTNKSRVLLKTGNRKKNIR